MLIAVFLSITVLFFIVLIVAKKLDVKMCAICGGILLTWIGLFALYRAGYFKDAVLLALLMGQSITGAYYFIKKRVARALQIFTLPFMLTLLALAYFSINWTQSVTIPLSALLVLWIVAYIIFAYRNDPGKKMVADAMMHCCEDK